MKISSDKLLPKILIVTFLLISILTVYYQVKNFEFIYYDDPKYVRDNPMVKLGISLDSIRWAFFSIGYASNWHPVTWLSHMLDVELYGLNSGMHHLTNVIFHIVNTLLLFFLFYRLTSEKWKCAAVAVLFALHPLHVESVAWIAERKDVLSTFFWILTTWSYVWYVESRGVRRYLLVMMLFVLGLMAKPMLVTLPFTLLLLDFWPIKRPELVKFEDDIASQSMRNNIVRINWAGVWPLIWEKMPLLILTGISSIITYLAQSRGGSVSNLDILPISSRIANAAAAYCTYLWRMIWPLNLAVFYPYPKMFNPLIMVGFFFLLILITLLAFKYTKRFPFLIMGWLWYLGTLLPVIGIVQVGYQSMADRYTYIPFIGIFVMLVWGITSLFIQWRIGRYVLVISFLTIIPVLMWATWVQAGYWKNSITLFSHALDVTKDNYLAHTNLAVALFEKGDVQGAIYHSSEALRIKPDYVPALCDLGFGLMKQGKYQEAIDHFRQSIQINPYYINAYYNLGGALFALGKIDEAIIQFQDVLRLDPQHAGAQKGIEHALAKQRKIDGVIAQMKEELKVDPKNSDLNYRLAELYMSKGNTKDAIAFYEKSLLNNPNLIQALNTLAVLYAQCGEYDNSLSSLHKVVKLKPNDPDVYYNIACIYSKQGRKDDAIISLKQAINCGFKKWNLLKTDSDLGNIRGTDFYRNLIH
jgi:tetratricopeptide (TPR) repeat protein